MGRPQGKEEEKGRKGGGEGRELEMHLCILNLGDLGVVTVTDPSLFLLIK